MTSHSTVVPLRQPDEIDDPLTEVLRSGARRLLAQAVEAEAEAFLAAMRELRLPDGRPRLVRHGHGPERQVQTGIGPVPVQRVKLRDRGTGDGGRADPLHLERSCHAGHGGRRAWMRCCRCSTCAGSRRATSRRRSAALLGKDAPNLSPSVIGRGCGASGRRTMRAGSGATCRPGATSTSGRTASTCRRGWSRRPNACWC